MYPSGRKLHENCTRVAASHMQNLREFACDWQPLRYKLHAPGGHSGTICMRLVASRIEFLHALAASCMDSSQIFASTLREQLFELKNEDAI